MNNPAGTILIVAAEGQLRRFLATALVSHAYQVEEAATSEEGFLKVALQCPDVVLLDLDRPQFDGVAFIQALRYWGDFPLIVLSSKESEADKIRALDAGADDYLTPPFGPGELFARIRAVLRRARGPATPSHTPIFQVGNLKIDLKQRSVLLGARPIHLTPTEYKLLVTLVQHVGKVLTHQQLLSTVWGPDYAHATQYLRVYMGNLRRKLETDPTQPRYLHTEPTIGYRLAAEGASRTDN